MAGELGIHLEGADFVVRDKSDFTLVEIPDRPKEQSGEPKTFKQGKEIGRHPNRYAAGAQIAELESVERQEAAIVAAKALLGV